MNFAVSFHFRGKQYSCLAFIDTSESPWYIFTILADGDLIQEFGEEITLKTDGNHLLPRSDDFTKLVELRRALFEAISASPRYKGVINDLSCRALACWRDTRIQ